MSYLGERASKRKAIARTKTLIQRPKDRKRERLEAELGAAAASYDGDLGYTEPAQQKKSQKEAIAHILQAMPERPRPWSRRWVRGNHLVLYKWMRLPKPIKEPARPPPPKLDQPPPPPISQPALAGLEDTNKQPAAATASSSGTGNAGTSINPSLNAGESGTTKEAASKEGGSSKQGAGGAEATPMDVSKPE